MEPIQMIEDPAYEQEQTLAAFGYKIAGWVSQKLKA
jgi:hypothetical protein